MRDTCRISLRLIFTKTLRNCTWSINIISLGFWGYVLWFSLHFPVWTPFMISNMELVAIIAIYSGCNLLQRARGRGLLSVAVSPASSMCRPLCFVTVNTGLCFSKIRPRKSSFTYTVFFSLFSWVIWGPLCRLQS